MIGKYDYQELREKALSASATQDDVNALGYWFSRYGKRYWNGELYDCGDNVKLYYVLQQIGPDEYEVVGYELR
jgi:hypothetical protein